MSFSEPATRVGFGLIAAAMLIGCRAQDDPQPEVQPRFDAQALAVEVQLEYIADGLKRYKGDVGDYPQKLEDLFASEAEGWSGPYIGSGPPVAPGAPSYGVGEHLTDAWGNPLEYLYDAESPQVTSLGPDKLQGTEDDIVVTVSADE